MRSSKVALSSGRRCRHHDAMRAMRVSRQWRARWVKIKPRPYMSDAVDTRPSVNISGDTCGCLARKSSRSSGCVGYTLRSVSMREFPKSVIYGTVTSSRTLSNFRSLCTMPILCMVFKQRRRFSTMRRPCSTVRGLAAGSVSCLYRVQDPSKRPMYWNTRARRQ